ncbi:hypothetical protein [Paenibacillus woosongensis]|uniref:DUF4064 domain-containing protein n=1 Tax=Paenibacillus woosongensis TaxID=307580 RepID=A0ABQ4MMN8_9BACL|nr:hypothetical protein [Paenibacillus woosongensis]GIP57174.1 hypothetical protein J15TS10_09880 [Paenibacillus woosongensis]
MQSNHRTPLQPSRGPGSEGNQAQARRMAGNPSGTAGSSMNRASGNQAAVGQVQGKGKGKKGGKKKQPVDRLGQAVVSLIFGIFGMLLFLLSCIKLNMDSQYSYTTSPGTMFTIVLAYIVNTVGFILGIRARRSTKGRGMAIAGITLTALPFVLMTLFIGGAIILTFLLLR